MFEITNQMPPPPVEGETLDPARAYVLRGDWVADCPRPGCANVEFLFSQTKIGGPRIIRKPFFTCSYCGAQAEIGWARREAEIMEVLDRRPVPDTRNWYPHDHPDAIRFGVPHGQSIKDLQAENEAHGVI